jgi:hypothetical protein
LIGLALVFVLVVLGLVVAFFRALVGSNLRVVFALGVFVRARCPVLRSFLETSPYGGVHTNLIILLSNGCKALIDRLRNWFWLGLLHDP